MTEAGAWRLEALEEIARLSREHGLDKDIGLRLVDRVEQYYNDEQGYDNPDWSNAERFVHEELWYIAEEIIERKGT